MFYNKEIKKRFIDTLNTDDMKKTYSYLFKKTKVKEDEIGKDLYDFTPNEVEDLFYMLNIKSRTSFLNKRSLLNSYISWAIEEGYSKSKINYIDTPLFYSKDIYKKYVNKTALKNKYITIEQLKNIEDFCVNYQDKLIFRLRFEGLSLDEIRNLTIMDIYDDINTLILTNEEGSKRKVKVSNDCIKMIKQSINEDIYYKNNGMVSPDIKASYISLIDSGYIMRGRKGTYGKLSEPVIFQRFNKIISLLGLSKLQYLTLLSLNESGMIYYTKQLLQEKGELNEQDYKNICIRFNKNPLTWHELKNILKNS